MALLPPILSGSNDHGRPRIVPIPGMPGESIDQRILADVLWLIGRFKVRVTDGYAASGHAAGGDHPKGGGVDLIPDVARGGTWDDVDALAAFARKHPEVFRWIGYDGVPGHGRGHHLHLSWHGFGTDGDKGPLKLISQGTGGALPPGAGPGLRAGAAAADEAKELPEKVARALVGLIVDAIGKDGARVLLSVALVTGAIAAIGVGVARAAGVRAAGLQQLGMAVATRGAVKPKPTGGP